MVKLPRVPSAPVEWGALTWFDADAPLAANLTVGVREGPLLVSQTDPGGSGLVGVPRYCAALPDLSERDQTATGKFFDASFRGELRPYQIAPCEHVFTELESGGGGAILSAPTGAGKAVVAAWLAARVGVTTCIVVPKGDLMKQIVETIREFTDLPAEDVDTWQGQKLPREDAKVVVAMLQSVYRGCYPAEVYRRFGLLIIDELHRTGAPEFGRTLSLFPARWRVGLSATPERRDGMTDVIKAHVGTRVVQVETDQQPPDVYWIDTDWRPPPGADYDPKRGGYVKNSLFLDPLRNQAIAAAAMRASAAGRRTVVFCEQVKQVGAILASVRAAVPHSLTAQYGGNDTPEDRRIAHECPRGVVIVATYKKMGEGTDIPDLDTCILGAPLYDATQPVGRILRTRPEKPTPVVVDVRDPKSQVLKRLASARMKFLVQSGARVKAPFK